MDYYLGVLKKYAVFSGRATRSEYWYFILFSIIIGTAINLLGIFGINANVIGNIYGLAVLIPTIAVFVRRLHDTNHTGWWFFLGFIPLIGQIILIVFLATDSDPSTNQYGVNPKGLTPAQVA